MASDPSNNRWTHTYPQLGNQGLPLGPYLSKDNFELERVKLFSRIWLCTEKRTEDISHAGDYFTLDIGESPEPPYSLSAGRMENCEASTTCASTRATV